MVISGGKNVTWVVTEQFILRINGPPPTSSKAHAASTTLHTERSHRRVTRAAAHESPVMGNHGLDYHHCSCYDWDDP